MMLKRLRAKECDHGDTGLRGNIIERNIPRGVTLLLSVFLQFSFLITNLLAASVQLENFTAGADIIWQQTNGPNGGNIKSIAIDPATPQTLYAGTYGGGVFKSVNGGTSWSGVSTGLTNTVVHSLALDPSAPQTLYAGTNGGGVFKSANGGTSWSAANSGLTSVSDVFSLALDPSNPQTLYAGTNGGGIFKSVNGGTSWNSVNSGLTNAFVLSLAFDPSNPQTLYAGTNDGGIFKSVNGGTSWNSVNSGLTNAFVLSLALDPSNPQTLYAGTGVDGGGFFKSVNGGTSWSAVNTGLAGTPIYSLAFDPSAPQTLYAGTDGGGVIKSVNGGTSWSGVNTGLTNARVYSLALDPSSTQTLYAGTNGGGVFKSVNGGTNWSAVNTRLAGTPVISLALDPSAPQTLYAGTNVGGIFKSVNGGTSWSAVNSGLTNACVLSLALDPSAPQTLYAGTNGGGVFKSVNGGTNWSEVNTGLLLYTGVFAIAIDPTTPQTIYAGTYGGGVFKSINGGTSWSDVNTGLAGTYIYSLVLDPAAPQTLYAGPVGGVFKSVNGGTSWTAANTGLAGTYIYSLALDPSTSQTIYAGTDGGGVFKSVNGGTSWSAANSGLTSVSDVFSLALDPSNPQTLYAGTADGVFKSVNGGTSWSAANTGLAGTYIKSLALGPSTSQTLYVGTRSAGVFKGTIDGSDTFTVTPSTDANGSISPNTVQTVNSGSTAIFTITPAIGYQTVTPIGGTCPQGTLSGNSYSTGAIIIDCTVTPTFALTPVPGVCGSANSQTFTIAPTTNLCSPNAAVTLTTTATGWSWTCPGSNGGTPAICSANLQTYAITFQSGGNGTLTGTASQTINYGGNASTVTAVPATGYRFINWTEGATVVGTVAALSITNVTAPHSYTANFAAPVPGVCGSSHAAILTVAPTTNLCSTGTPSAVTGSGPWTWTCSGSTGGKDADCVTYMQGKAAVQLPQTGLDICYNRTSDPTDTVIACSGTGQDGELQKGLAWPVPRFADNGDQTVTDKLTGLIWTRDANLMKTRDPAFDTDGTQDGVVTWQHALDYVKKLNSDNYLGHNDWRLPNYNELESLVNRGQVDTATWLTGQGFLNVQSYYCSSTTNTLNPAYGAFYVDMHYGIVDVSPRMNGISYVWPVRSGQPGSFGSLTLRQTGQTTCYDSAGTVIDCSGTGQDGELQSGAASPNPRFVDNGNLSVTDNLFGLVWSKDGNMPGPAACGPAATKSWQGALDYIKCLNSNSYLGKSDWRLPNQNELESLVNKGQASPATWLNGQGFSNINAGYYWSSSTYASLTGFAWSVHMSYGTVDYYYKNSNYNVLPVRDEQPELFGLLYISKSGIGSGSVTSSPASISCGATCSGSFDFGTSVTLTATPATGSTFTGWSGACSGAGICTVAMDASKIVNAAFNLQTYAVIFQSGSNGTLTGATSQTINYGSSTTAVTAVPTTGYHFVNWTGTGDFVTTTTNPLTVANVTAAQDIRANFAVGAELWQQTNAPYGGNINSLTIDPANSQTLYAGTSGGGVFKSANGGTSWNSINTGLTNTYIRSIAIDPATPQTLYAGTFDGDFFGKAGSGVFKSINGGTSWSAANTGLTNIYVFSLAIDPVTPQTLYAGTGVGVFKSVNGGTSWSAVNSGLTNTIVYTLAIDPSTPQTLYAGTSGGGVFKSVNGGTSWSPINTGQSPNAYVFSIAIDPVTPQTLYAGTSGPGVFKSINGGTSWSTVNIGLTYTFVFSLAIDPSTPQTLYASGGGVFKSVNGGASWSAINAGLTSTDVRSLAIDPTTPHTLYAGTYDGIVFKSQYGSFVSLTVSKSGTGIGSVTSSPFGISCGATCGASFVTGTSVTLTATSATGSTFAGWSGACSGTGTCTVTMDVAKSVNAAFNLQTYTVTFQSGGNGAITGTTSQTINYGGSTTAVTAVPSTGYHFVNWTEGAAVVGTSAALTINNVNAPHSYTANFAVNPIPGVCGAANNHYFKIAPTTGLCSPDLSVPVTPTASGWTWSCPGSNGGAAANCAATFDNTGPALFLSTLPSGVKTANEVLNIIGSASDVSNVTTLTLNGVDITPNASGFNQAIRLLNVPAVNNITISATDGLGNISTDTRTITYDPALPNITLTSAPADGGSVATSLVTVSGSVADATITVTIALNGVFISSTAGPTFNQNLTLTPGINTITITAVSNQDATQTNTIKRTVTFNATKPSLAITTPAVDIFTQNGSAAIGGAIAGAAEAVSLQNSTDSGTTWAALAATSNGTTPGTYSFTYTFANAPGTYPVLIRAIRTSDSSEQVRSQRNFIYSGTSYTVTPSAGTGSSISPTTPQSVISGNITSFTVTANAGYGILSVTGCNGTLSGSNYTTGAIIGNCNVSVTTVKHNGNGGASPDPTIADALKALQAYFGTVTLTPAEKILYDVAPIAANGVPQGNGVVDIADVIMIMRRIVGIGNW